MLEIVADIFLATHLLCVNIAAGLPLICFWLSWRSRNSQSPCAEKLAVHLALAAIAALLFGGLIGLCLGAWLWTLGDREIVSGLLLMPSKLFFGVWELLFFLACMGIVWAVCKFWRTRGLWVQALIGIFALAASSNLLWHFPPLFTAAHVLARTGLDRPPLDAADFREVLFTPEVLSLSVHVWLASFAVASLFVMVRLVGKSVSGWKCASSEVAQLTTQHARVALATSLLQVPVGIWVFLSLPQQAQNRIGGGDAIATLLFAAAVLTVLGLLHQLANLSIGNSDRRHKAVWLSAGLMFVTVLLMVSALRQARQISSSTLYGSHTSKLADSWLLERPSQIG